MNNGNWELGQIFGGGVDFCFLCALEREVSGVVRGWVGSTLHIGNAERRMYYSLAQRAVLVCAGTGWERAYSAAKACIERLSPGAVVSIGFAGACTPELEPGALVVPARLVVPGQGSKYGTGEEFPCAFGYGTLVTLNAVAATAAKREARKLYGALAVEMEAAGVAAAAAEMGSKFLAIKAISDGVEEEMDFLSAFVTPEGFDSRRFLAHIAVRPALWGRVAALHRNSQLAAATLESAVGECCSDWQSFVAKHS
jgi:adenosylhomocysteine nucleosidase